MMSLAPWPVVTLLSHTHARIRPCSKHITGVACLHMPVLVVTKELRFIEYVPVFPCSIVANGRTMHALFAWSLELSQCSNSTECCKND